MVWFLLKTTLQVVLDKVLSRDHVKILKWTFALLKACPSAFLEYGSLIFRAFKSAEKFAIDFSHGLSLVLLNWDSQQSRPFSLPSQKNFPISFKPKLAIAEFFWKMQRKSWYSILGSDAMPLSLKNLLLKISIFLF
jgi:hypothetical protein